MTLGLMCGSRKPAPGDNSPSASREMLREVERGARAAGARTRWVDLRDYELPLWDGRDAIECGGDAVKLLDDLCACAGFVISAPAYWNALSGTLLNAFDLVGTQPFRGKLAAAVVVGMDEASAWNGATQLRSSVAALGAWSPPEEIVVGNPREHPDVEGLRRELAQYGAYVGMLLLGTAQPFAKAEPTTVPGLSEVSA